MQQDLSYAGHRDAATPDSSDAEDVQEAVVVLHEREGKVPLRNPAAQYTCHAQP